MTANFLLQQMHRRIRRSRAEYLQPTFSGEIKYSDHDNKNDSEERIKFNDRYKDLLFTPTDEKRRKISYAQNRLGKR